MRRDIPNPNGFTTLVGQIEVGGAAFVPEPIDNKNTLHPIGGEPTNDFVRLSIYLRDLNRCRVWMDLAEGSHDHDARDALHIAALITFMTCFQSTSGHRLRPLSIKRLYTPVQRAAYKELLRLRNRYIAHDEQDFPINAVGIELNLNAVAIYESTAVAFIPLHSWRMFDFFQELVDVAHAWVAVERTKASAELMIGFNALNEAERHIFKNGPPFTVSVSQE